MTHDVKPKKLKVSFAMGGGVSLGAFSGAALTEALKLLLIDGVDANGVPYENIELDSMSGASAGAISLCIILSCLLNYERYAADEDVTPTPRNKFKKSSIDKEVGEQFGEDWKIKYAGRVEALRALQFAQRLQERLWVDALNMTDLMRIEDFHHKDNPSFSLLNQDLLLELVDEFILTDLDKLDISGSQIVSKQRFLFACSLTNMAPMKLSQDLKNTAPALVQELQKAHASFDHKDLRIFDFQLTQNENSGALAPLKKAIHVGSDHHPTSSKETWAMISATCLACAAFPFAFAPVALDRYLHEYYDGSSIRSKKQKESEVILDDSPIEEENLNIELEFDQNVLDEGFEDEVPYFQSDFKTKFNKGITQYYKSYKGQHKTTDVEPDAPDDFDPKSTIRFSYVDGGTLNNEPIREAFRLANYLDSRDAAARESYDRIVIFVDPIVRTEAVTNHSADFNLYAEKGKHNTLRMKTHPELSKLQHYSTKLIRSLRDQGAMKEEHKISTYTSSIKTSQNLSELILQSNFPSEFSEHFITTFLDFIEYQERDNGDEKISSFDINDQQFLKIAILHYVKKNNIEANASHLFTNFNKLLTWAVHIKKGYVDNYEASCILNFKIPNQGQQQLIKKLVYSFIVQSILNTDGKDPLAMRMAITPVRYPVEQGETEQSVESRTIQMPGEEFQAFGGFVSHEARSFSYAYGRYCAFHTMSRPDFRSYYREIMSFQSGSCDRLIQAENFPNAMLDAYKNVLKELSPLRTVQKANAYWHNIKDNMYGLLKSRVAKSFMANLRWHTFAITGLLIGLAFVLPWIINYYCPRYGALSQGMILILAILYVWIKYKRIGLTSLKQSFRYHELDVLPMSILREKPCSKLSHYRFNRRGPYHKLLKTDTHYIVGLPHYTVRIRNQPDENEAIEYSDVLKFSPRKYVARSFNHVFSFLTNDVGEEVTSITFYQKSFFRYRPQESLDLDSEPLRQVAKIETINKHISPQLACLYREGQPPEIKLEEDAESLEHILLAKSEALDKNRKIRNQS